MKKHIIIKNSILQTTLLILFIIIIFSSITFAQDFAIEFQTLKGHSEEVSSISFSPNGRYLASGSADNTIKIWELSDGRFSEIQTLEVNSYSVESVTFSPNGKYLASTSFRTIKIWEFFDGYFYDFQTIKDYPTNLISISFSSDSKYLAYCVNRKIRVWGFSNNKFSKFQTLKSHYHSVECVSFSIEGNYIASGSGKYDKTIEIWKLSNEKFVKFQNLDDHSGAIGSVCFSPDGKFIASGSDDNTIKIWEFSNGKFFEFQTLKGHSKRVNSVSFNPVDNFLASCSGDKTIKIWDIEKLQIDIAGKKIKMLLSELKIIETKYSPDITDLLKPKGEFETTDQYNKRLQAADQQKKQFQKEYAEIIKKEKHQIYQDLNPLLSKTYPVNIYTMNIGTYNPDKEEFPITISGISTNVKVPFHLAIEFKKNKHQVVGQKRYYLTQNNELKSELFNIQIITTDGQVYAFKEQTVDTSPPEITILYPEVKRGLKIITREETQLVKGNVIDESEIKELLLNGISTDISNDGSFSGEIPLSIGRNNITIICSDIYDNTVIDTFTITREEIEKIPETKPPIPEYKPDLWILSIGISQYKNPKINLKYADNDALKIAKTFEQQTGRLFNNVYYETILNETATREIILEKMSTYLGQASSEDVVLIFIAGHGVKHKQTGSYYFLTYDAEPFNLLSKGLRWSDFDEAIKIIKINVSKLVLLFDTCHAGAMQVAMRGAEAGENLAEQLKESEGTFILSASKAGEESIESEEYKLPGEIEGHGAFTYTILKALAGEADYDNDYNIFITELFRYVDKNVPKITKGRQHPYQRISGTDMPIFTVE